MNIWAGIILAAVAIGAYGFTKLAKAGANLVTETKGRVHALDLTGITFAIDALIKNPSNTSLTIQYPFIKISYKENLIASSNLVNRLVTIAPLTQTNIKDIKIPVSYIKLTGVGSELIQKIQDKTKKVTLQVTIITQIHLAGSIVPFSKTEDVTF